MNGSDTSLVFTLDFVVFLDEDLSAIATTGMYTCYMISPHAEAPILFSLFVLLVVRGWRRVPVISEYAVPGIIRFYKKGVWYNVLHFMFCFGVICVAFCIWYAFI